eukprot:SAG11_NODE_186_length_13142_cov_17.515679_4_plen_108_part_00
MEAVAACAVADGSRHRSIEVNATQSAQDREWRTSRHAWHGTLRKKVEAQIASTATSPHAAAWRPRRATVLRQERNEKSETQETGRKFDVEASMSSYQVLTLRHDKFL